MLRVNGTTALKVFVPRSELFALEEAKPPLTFRAVARAIKRACESLNQYVRRH